MAGQGDERGGAEVLTAAQMRAVEHAAIASGAVTGAALMERAGRAVVEAVFARWPALAAAPRRAIVLCGPGNNGGDGFVIARLLKDWGWEIALFLHGDAARLPPDARANLDLWAARGAVRPADAITGPAELARLNADLFVDALFGIGLNRPIARTSPLRPFFEHAARWQEGGGPPTVAVDLPSGLCSDSGAVLGGAADGLVMRAALTVTFHAAKPGHLLLPPGPEGSTGALCCGDLVVADIGLPRQGPARLTGAARAQLPPCARQAIACDPVPAAALGKSAPQGHKYSHGHALVLAGGPGRGGAARLAARAALRVGAGLVTLGSTAAALPENAARLDAVMLREIGDAAALAAALEDRRITALCLGPGLGVGDATRALVAAALAAGRPAVLDADALTSFAPRPEALFAATRGQAVVLTPHGGEFARLFPDIAARLDPAPA